MEDTVIHGISREVGHHGINQEGDRHGEGIQVADRQGSQDQEVAAVIPAGSVKLRQVIAGVTGHGAIGHGVIEVEAVGDTTGEKIYNKIMQKCQIELRQISYLKSKSDKSI